MWLTQFGRVQLSHFSSSHPGPIRRASEQRLYHDGFPPSSIVLVKHDGCSNSSWSSFRPASSGLENGPSQAAWRKRTRITAKNMPSRLGALSSFPIDHIASNLSVFSPQSLVSANEGVQFPAMMRLLGTGGPEAGENVNVIAKLLALDFSATQLTRTRQMRRHCKA